MSNVVTRYQKAEAELFEEMADAVSAYRKAIAKARKENPKAFDDFLFAMPNWNWLCEEINEITEDSVILFSQGEYACSIPINAIIPETRDETIQKLIDENMAKVLAYRESMKTQVEKQEEQERKEYERLKKKFEG